MGIRYQSLYTLVQDMLETTDVIHGPTMKKSDMRFSFLLTFSLGLTGLAWLFSDLTALSDPDKSATTASDSASNSKPETYKTTPSPSTLINSLNNMKRLDSLMKAGKVSDALSLSKSSLSEIDRYLIYTFSQPQSIDAIPPDVVSSMKKNNAESLSQFLNKELASEPGLENIKSVLSIRNNLKRIIKSLSVVR